MTTSPNLMTDSMPEMKETGYRTRGLPPKQGLYDPCFEHEACGVGFVVNAKGKKSHEIIRHGLRILINLNHRGACGCESNNRGRRGDSYPDAACFP